MKEKMKNKIIEWFQKNYPHYYAQMKVCYHEHSCGNKNPYHLENDVWTHTTMVMNEIKSENINLIFAALLHDLGKTVTRYEKETKVSFRGHENVSMYMSIDILKKAQQEFDIDSLTILKLIAWHGELWTKNDNEESFKDTLKNIDLKYGSDYEFYKLLLEFVKADAFGRTMESEYEVLRLEEQFTFLENYTPYNSDIYIQEKEKVVYCLIGMSGSGKSTFVENLQKKEFHSIISVDKYLEKGKLGYNFIDYDKKVKDAHNQSLVEIKEVIQKRENCIIDMTNLTKESRRKKLSQFPSTTYKKIGIVFLNGEENLMVNLKKRKDKTIPKDVLEKQMATFELPGMDEFHSCEYKLF